KRLHADLAYGLRLENDRVLEHALIFGIIENNNRKETAKGLNDTARVRRGALIALDQMKDGNLTREEVVDCLDTTDVPLQAAAMEIITRRKWTDEIISFARNYLDQPEFAKVSDAQRAIV